MPAARVLSVDAPALVIGSTQPLVSVDAGPGVDLVRRNSGGGAVLLRPGELLWIDVFLPVADPLWEDDVGRAGLWLGEVWVAALGDLGVEAHVHEGAYMAPMWAHLACFAGLAPGEVTVGPRKVIGVSQRRARAGALFQCAALLTWDPGALTRLLALDARARDEVTHQLSDAAAGLGLGEDALAEAFLARLAAR